MRLAVEAQDLDIAVQHLLEEDFSQVVLHEVEVLDVLGADEHVLSLLEEDLVEQVLEREELGIDL